MNLPLPIPVLVVEDEPKLAALLADYLKASGFTPVVVHDGLQAVPVFRESAPQLVLLDLMLPGRDGLDICRELRSFSTVPIVMLTARVEEVDRLLGLDIGADDYLCKPYSPREVIARVKAQLRRCGWTAQATAVTASTGAPVRPEAQGLALDTDALRATLNGQALDLTPGEFRLLHTLSSAPGRVFSRERLLDRLHDDGRAVTDRAIDSHIRNLRRKLESATPCGDPIRSVYGVGYAWEPQGVATA